MELPKLKSSITESIDLEMADHRLEVSEASQEPSQVTRQPSVTPNRNANALVDINWHEITAKLARGDDKSFGVFYDHFFDVMFVEAKRLIGRDENSCLDIVQDAMLKSMRSIKPIAERSQLTQWVRTVVKSVAYDWLKRRVRRRETTGDSLLGVRSSEDRSWVKNEARMIWIEQQLYESAPQLQKLFSMRFRLGMTLKQIAQKLGIKTGAVDGRIRRAVEQLKNKAKLEFDDE